jgi:hypothetical protein
MPSNPVFGGYISTGVVQAGFEGITPFIKHIQIMINIFIKNVILII